MVSDDLRRILEPSAPWPVPWREINIVFGPVPASMVAVPFSVVAVPHSIGRVVARVRRGAFALRIMGATIGGTVYLNISEKDLNTAAGRALAAHELYHVYQMQTIPDFDELYEAYADQTPPDKPWLNPLELPAYQVEAREYCDLVAQGVPAGRWLPLGVELWGCGGA